MAEFFMGALEEGVRDESRHPVRRPLLYVRVQQRQFAIHRSYVLRIAGNAQRHARRGHDVENALDQLAIDQKARDGSRNQSLVVRPRDLLRG